MIGSGGKLYRRHFSRIQISLYIQVIFALVYFFSSVAMAELGVMSSVSIVKPTEYLAKVNAARSDTQLIAYRMFVEIFYDQIVQRPWGEKFLPEAQTRWLELRRQLCPHVQELCQLPERFSSTEEFSQIVKSVHTGAVLEALKRYFLSKNYALSVAVYPELEASGVPAIVLSSSQVILDEANPRRRGLTTNNIRHEFREFVHIAGPKDYGGARAEFILLSTESPDTVIYNLDALNVQAMQMAWFWYEKVRGKATPQSESSPILFYEKNVFGALEARHQDELAAIYERLYKQISTSQDAEDAKTLARFLKDRAKGIYPEEVYQDFLLHQFLHLVKAQGTLISLILQNGVALDQYSKGILPILLAAETVDPTLLLVMALTEVNEPGTSPLGQLVSGEISKAYLYEFIRYLLDWDKYADNNNFARFRYAFDSKDLFVAQSLKEQDRGLYGILSQGESIASSQQTFSDDKLKSVLQRYIRDEQGRLMRVGFLRSAMSIILRLKPEDARMIAHSIFQSRSGNLFAGSEGRKIDVKFKQAGVSVW